MLRSPGGRPAIAAVRIGDAPRPLRLRRLALLWILLRPRAASRLLEDLAAEADMYRVAVGVVLAACALCHQAQPGTRTHP